MAWPEDTFSYKQSPKTSSAVCCGIWTAPARARAASFTYSCNVTRYRPSAVLESALECFESSKAPLKKFIAHCSAIRRRIN